MLWEELSSILDIERLSYLNHALEDLQGKGSLRYTFSWPFYERVNDNI